MSSHDDGRPKLPYNPPYNLHNVCTTKLHDYSTS
jgi:hypothetical protein